MSSRRGHFRELTIGAWISALALFPVGAGCIPGSVSGGPVVDIQTGTGGSSVGTGGSQGTGTGGSRGTGGASATATLACSETPAGCVCVNRDSQTSDLGTCSGTSVASKVGETGSCCKSADLCTCTSFACKSDTGLSFCQCAPASDLPATLTGAASSECPAPATDQKCCFSMDTKSCICSPSDCDGGSMMVANCTLAVVSVCGTNEQTATSCK